MHRRFSKIDGASLGGLLETKWNLLALLCSLVAVVIMAVRPVSLVSQSAGEKIVFASNRAGPNRDIYIMNPDGSGVVPLTFSPASDSQPALSPDRTRVVFVSDRDGNPELYVMNADGTNQTRLTFNTDAEHGPKWCPDGKTIVYGFREAETTDIFRIDVDRGYSSRINLTNSPAVNELWPACSPDLNPDPQAVVFKIAFTDGDIWIMNADGTNPVHFLPRRENDIDLDASQAVAADGSWKIAWSAGVFRKGGDLIYKIFTVTVKPDGTAGTVTDTTRRGFEPAWSPDGTKIAFAAKASKGSFGFDIFVMNADGTGLVDVTNFAKDDRFPSWR